MKIDVFNHFMPKQIYDRLREIAPHVSILDAFSHLPALWDIDARLSLMDRFDGYQQVLSLSNPPIEVLGNPQVTPILARRANDSLAATCKKYPDRFPAFIASLPMNNPEAAVKEAERAIRELDARGVQMFTNALGKPLSAPEVYPVFETMARHDLPVWLHPARGPDFPDYAAETVSENEIWFTFGWPYETAACMTRLIFSGIFDKLPNLKIIAHHMDGMIPYLSERISLGFEQIFNGENDRNPSAERTGLKEQPIEYYRMLYAGTATNGSLAALRCGHDFFTTDHCLFATGAPFDSEGGARLIGRTIDAVNALDIPAIERTAIFEANARKLLKLA